MTLTSQQFAEVINYLRDRASATAGSEKRRATRMELKSKITIAPVKDGKCGERIAVLTRDLSMNGIGLLTGVALREGQQFIAALPRGENQNVFVLCNVTHCGVVADGIFSLGCQFIQALTTQAADQMQTPPSPDIVRIRESVLR